MSRPAARLEAVAWRPAGREILSGFSLALEAGKITGLVGHSGCGKSSLLRLLAGLRAPDAGEITGVPAARAFVFQDAALLPWRTLRENVALPLSLQGAQEGQASAAIDAAIARVGLAAVADQLPKALSGGQRMRASLARALVSKPELVLLDEAFAALDGLTRASVQRFFLELQQEAGWTVVMVTHELEDALRMCDRVIALAGPPLRIVRDVEVALPRPRPAGHPQVGAWIEALSAALQEGA